MSYIVLNGKKSTLINGLLISSLPPISKPKMRAQFTEIDGRDGDVVTKLGYAAYSKKIKIGLFGRYDVNDVIAYFDSEGIVTFSNEPDKYYIYQIIDQIDLERLIRFKTAEVTFHVQPFKYSAVEKLIDKDFNLFSAVEHQEEKRGVALSAIGNTITIKGTASAATEFYLPIREVDLDTGFYTLTATATGTAPNQVAIRLIDDIPSDANTFGGKYVYLKNGSVLVQADLTAKKSYNYLWFYVLPNVAMDFEVSVALEHEDKSVTVTNVGNIESKPVITIYGSGTIGITLNGSQIFSINLGDEEYITIDAAQMEAYKNGILKNRLVTGDYENLALKVGKNTIAFSGDVTKFDIVNYSRWI